jgi:uncharacterized protein DUF4386
LRQQFAGSGADAGTLVVAGQTMVAFHDWTFLLSPGLCAGIGNGLLLGYIVYTSGLLPLRIAMLGLPGERWRSWRRPGLLGVYERQSGPQLPLTVPEML